MLKKDHRRRGVPSPGSPTQCVPVHFHHVVPAEHGVAFSPALWDASLFSHRVFVCARACRATLSRAFVISLFQGLQHGLAIEPHCGHLGWIQTGDSTRIPPMQPPKAHLSDRAGLPSGLPRSPSLLQLSFLSYSFSRLTKCPWQNRDGSTVDSPSCPPSPLFNLQQQTTSRLEKLPPLELRWGPVKMSSALHVYRPNHETWSHPLITVIVFISGVRDTDRLVQR